MGKRKFSLKFKGIVYVLLVCVWLSLWSYIHNLPLNVEMVAAVSLVHLFATGLLFHIIED